MIIKIEVLNKHHSPDEVPNLINIMRPNPLGNPFPILKDSTRSDVISQYDIWLEDQLRTGDAKIIDALEEIATKAITKEGVHLLCCCVPAACHGNVIKRYVINALKGLEPWAHHVLPRPSRLYIKDPK